MFATISKAFALMFILFAPVTAQQPGAPPPPQRSPGSMMPDGYSIISETNFARCVTLEINPNESTSPHPRNDAVIYALSGGELLVHHETGEIEQLEIPSGSAAIVDESPSVTIENTSDGPVQFLIVERISSGDAPMIPTSENPDAVAATPEHYDVIAEGNGLRVIEMAIAPGERDNWYSHPAELMHFVTETSALISTPDAEPQKVQIPAGATVFMPPRSAVAWEAAGEIPLEALIVEIHPDENN